MVSSLASRLKSELLLENHPQNRVKLLVQRQESTYPACPLNCRRIDLFETSKTWVIPLSQPATRSFPSGLKFGLRARSLNRPMVLRTSPTLVSMRDTPISAAAANSYGSRGEKQTPVTAPGSSSLASVLKEPHFFSSGVERPGAKSDCLRTTTGANSSMTNFHCHDFSLGSHEQRSCIAGVPRPDIILHVFRSETLGQN